MSDGKREGESQEDFLNRVLTRLGNLQVDEVSAVDKPANGIPFLIVKADGGSEMSDQTEEQDNKEAAVWSTKRINDLPDSSFLLIESGGEKDDDDRTVPRSLRHLPYRDETGKVDLPHIRNAIAQAPKLEVDGLTDDDKAKLQDKARAILEEAKKTDSETSEDSNVEQQESDKEEILSAISVVSDRLSSVLSMVSDASVSESDDESKMPKPLSDVIGGIAKLLLGIVNKYPAPGKEATEPPEQGDESVEEQELTLSPKLKDLIVTALTSASELVKEKWEKINAIETAVEGTFMTPDVSATLSQLSIALDGFLDTHPSSKEENEGDNPDGGDTTKTEKAMTTIVKIEKGDASEKAREILWAVMDKISNGLLLEDDEKAAIETISSTLVAAVKKQDEEQPAEEEEEEAVESQEAETGEEDDDVEQSDDVNKSAGATVPIKKAGKPQLSAKRSKIFREAISAMAILLEEMDPTFEKEAMWPTRKVDESGEEESTPEDINKAKEDEIAELKRENAALAADLEKSQKRVAPSNLSKAEQKSNGGPETKKTMNINPMDINASFK